MNLRCKDTETIALKGRVCRYENNTVYLERFKHLWVFLEENLRLKAINYFSKNYVTNFWQGPSYISHGVYIQNGPTFSFCSLLVIA